MEIRMDVEPIFSLMYRVRNAIKIQTDVFANYLKKLIQDNTLDNLFVPLLASYEFKMKDVFYETNTGVDYYYIKENKTTKTASNDDN